ncbi:MAG: hypothetical protein ABJA78_08145 [Ferruginibacter sp.]
MYFKRLIIVVLLTWTAVWLTGKLFDYRYHKRWSYLYFDKIDQLLKKDSSYDVIFVGDSRTHEGINPFYVDSITGLNSYNFGFAGSDGEELKLVSTLYLQSHQHPKLAVITIDAGTLEPLRILKQRFCYLSYMNNDNIAAYMSSNGFPKFISYFPFLKYSFFDEYNRLSIFTEGSKIPQFDHNIYKGFLNVDQFVNRTGKIVFGNNIKEIISDTAVTDVKSAISLFVNRNIRVVLVYPPEKKSGIVFNSQVKKQADAILSSISQEYKIPLWHFDTAAVYTNEYFVDDVHLNEPGTRIYSKQIADSILSLLK